MPLLLLLLMYLVKRYRKRCWRTRAELLLRVQLQAGEDAECFWAPVNAWLPCKVERAHATSSIWTELLEGETMCQA